MAERVGFEPTCREARQVGSNPTCRASSQHRYDHFGTSLSAVLRGYSIEKSGLLRGFFNGTGWQVEFRDEARHFGHFQNCIGGLKRRREKGAVPFAINLTLSVAVLKSPP